MNQLSEYFCHNIEQVFTYSFSFFIGTFCCDHHAHYILPYFYLLSELHSGKPATLVSRDNIPASTEAEMTNFTFIWPSAVAVPIVANAVCAIVLTALLPAHFAHFFQSFISFTFLSRLLQLYLSTYCSRLPVLTFVLYHMHCVLFLPFTGPVTDVFFESVFS